MNRTYECANGSCINHGQRVTVEATTFGPFWGFPAALVCECGWLPQVVLIDGKPPMGLWQR